MAATYDGGTIIADEQFIERQRLFEDFLASDVNNFEDELWFLLKHHFICIESAW